MVVENKVPGGQNVHFHDCWRFDFPSARTDFMIKEWTSLSDSLSGSVHPFVGPCAPVLPVTQQNDDPNSIAAKTQDEKLFIPTQLPELPQLSAELAPRALRPRAQGGHVQLQRRALGEGRQRLERHLATGRAAVERRSRR